MLFLHWGDALDLAALKAEIGQAFRLAQFLFRRLLDQRRHLPDTRKGVFRASQIWLAKEINVTDRTIRNWLRALIDAGYIEVVVRDNQFRGPSVYSAVFSKFAAIAEGKIFLLYTKLYTRSTESGTEESESTSTSGGGNAESERRSSVFKKRKPKRYARNEKPDAERLKARQARMEEKAGRMDDPLDRKVAAVGRKGDGQPRGAAKDVVVQICPRSHDRHQARSLGMAAARAADVLPYSRSPNRFAYWFAEQGAQRAAEKAHRSKHKAYQERELYP